MKKLIILFTFLITTISIAQVGINTTNPDNSAILDVVSTDKGFLPPRLTTAERDAILNPAEGLVIYNESANAQCLQVYRNVANGNGWFDICCPEAVSQLANFSAAGILFSPDKFFAGADGAGGAVANGGDVGSVGPVDLSAFGAQYPSAAYFNKFEGTNEASSVSITQTLLNTNINEYSATAFLTKNGDFFDKGVSDSSDYLYLDLSSVTTSNDYEGDLTLTLVGRYNALPGGGFKGFFAVGQSTNPGTFQLGNINTTQYRIAAGGTTIRSNSSTDPNPVPIDTKFHLFNVVYTAATDKIDFYIDGVLQIDTNNSQMRLNTLIRLLTNRNGEISVNGSIAYFGIDPVKKTQAEISSLSKGINCLFAEL